MKGIDKDIIEASGYAYIKERDKFKDVLKPKIYSRDFDLSVKVGIDYGNGKDVTASIIGFTNSKGQFIVLANFDDTTKIGKMIIDELDKMRTKSVDDFKEVNLKALEIIKEYQVDVWLLKQCDYENYIRIRKEAMVSIGQFVNENGVVLEDEIPEEYFDLVKRWVR